DRRATGEVGAGERRGDLARTEGCGTEGRQSRRVRRDREALGAGVTVGRDAHVVLGRCGGREVEVSHERRGRAARRRDRAVDRVVGVRVPREGDRGRRRQPGASGEGEGPVLLVEAARRADANRGREGLWGGDRREHAGDETGGGDGRDAATKRG